MITELDLLMDDLTEALIKHRVDARQLRNDLRKWLDEQLPHLDERKALGET